MTVYLLSDVTLLLRSLTFAVAMHVGNQSLPLCGALAHSALMEVLYICAKATRTRPKDPRNLTLSARWRAWRPLARARPRSNRRSGGEAHPECRPKHQREPSKFAPFIADSYCRVHDPIMGHLCISIHCCFHTLTPKVIFCRYIYQYLMHMHTPGQVQNEKKEREANMTRYRK